ncbi:hypothetical protein AAMO2058_001225300 [Amorphochlora amoebiformis]
MRMTTTRALALLLASLNLTSAREPRIQPGRNGAKVLLLGGTGRIGTVVAMHLLSRSPDIQVVLAGRNEGKGRAAVEEIRSEIPANIPKDRVQFQRLDWRDSKSLASALQNEVDAVVHTAGPYSNEKPEVLQTAIQQRVPVYVDVSDPMEFIEACKDMDNEAKKMGTLAMPMGGAFPGLSNVLAMECAHRLGGHIKDIDFSFFTAGLGGSGEINLYITNEGFGEPIHRYEDGKPVKSMTSGGEPRTADFFISSADPSKQLVGTRQIWNWPFPEPKTVGDELEIVGKSTVGMGTAPDIWNYILTFMTTIVPKSWWKSKIFSEGLAKFSKPLVEFTDKFVGETHAMRIDVRNTQGKQLSAVQAHESFRRVVGQSCAEFTLALLGDCNGAYPSYTHLSYTKPNHLYILLLE